MVALAALPVVSGIICLVLARAEFLGTLHTGSQVNYAGITWDEMYEILRSSAWDQVSFYQDPGGDPMDTPGWDHHYGHDMVRAYRTLLALERLHCRADRTANNTPGSVGYGIPDAQVTQADWDYFVDRLWTLSRPPRAVDPGITRNQPPPIEGSRDRLH